MATHAVSLRTTGAGSSTLPVASLFAAAATGFYLLEAHIFNTTATAVTMRLMRATAQGTPGAGLTETEDDEDGAPPLCTAFDTHTVAPTLGDERRRVTLPGAVGAGMVWTFEPRTFRVKPGTGNGVVLIPSGTGQIVDAVLVWEE
jgi:hypothetical protein